MPSSRCAPVEVAQSAPKRGREKGKSPFRALSKKRPCVIYFITCHYSIDLVFFLWVCVVRTIKDRTEKRHIYTVHVFGLIEVGLSVFSSFLER